MTRLAGLEIHRDHRRRESDGYDGEETLGTAVDADGSVSRLLDCPPRDDPPTEEEQLEQEDRKSDTASRLQPREGIRLEAGGGDRQYQQSERDADVLHGTGEPRPEAATRIAMPARAR